MVNLPFPALKALSFDAALKQHLIVGLFASDVKSRSPGISKTSENHDGGGHGW
jgi:hypothetical protein